MIVNIETLLDTKPDDIPISHLAVAVTTPSNSTTSQRTTIPHLLSMRLLVWSDAGLQCPFFLPSCCSATIFVYYQQNSTPAASIATKIVDSQRVSKCPYLISRRQMGTRIGTSVTLPAHFSTFTHTYQLPLSRPSTHFTQMSRPYIAS